MAKKKAPPFKPDKSNMPSKSDKKPAPTSKTMKGCNCGGHRGK